MFTHQVLLPPRSYMVEPEMPRKRRATMESVIRVKPRLKKSASVRMPYFDEEEAMSIRFLEEDDNVPYVDRSSMSTTVDSWEDSDSDHEMEIVSARDSFSSVSRISGIYKLQHTLLLVNSRARRSYSCTDIADTGRKVSEEFLANWRLRARRSPVAGFELQLVEWAQVILSYENQIYEDRCLRDGDRRHIELDLQHVTKKIEAIQTKLAKIHNVDHLAKHQAYSAAMLLRQRVDKILVDVAGTHHFNRCGQVDYMQL
ncbi:hypothetical protein THRCLA_11803 [Thraustotheca clavata]|uniref:Uncharacterized protein n=1 Tax=Thraustotheca clavata TaxID=74557 RepID=A0A1V9Y6M3_9STRA|nr:hypothetical protein THRCLA_11803 [Thraustotheca clavata]